MIVHLHLASNAPLPVTSEAWRQAPSIVSQGEWCGHVASDILRSRTLRRRLLPDMPLADCAWDMLLDLYLCEHKGVRVSISDLALAADVPRSTGVRWVGNLIEAGTLQTSPDADDGRRTWVTLSAAARGALERYFVELLSGSHAAQKAASADIKMVPS